MKGPQRKTVSLLFLVMASGVGVSSSLHRPEVPAMSTSFTIKERQPLPYRLPKEYALYVTASCAENGVPLWIYCRLIDRESGWKAKIVKKNKNGTRDLGLAQLNSKYIADYAVRFNDGKKIDPFDPLTSIRVSTRYLSELYRELGDWKRAVLAYNVGLSAVLRGRIPESGFAHVEAIFSE